MESQISNYKEQIKNLYKRIYMNLGDVSLVEQFEKEIIELRKKIHKEDKEQYVYLNGINISPFEN